GHGSHDDDCRAGDSGTHDPPLAPQEDHQRKAEAFQSARFHVLSLSTMVSCMTMQLQGLEAGPVGNLNLYGECTLIQKILETLKCACDKTSNLEQVEIRGETRSGVKLQHHFR